MLQEGLRETEHVKLSAGKLGGENRLLALI